MKSLRLSIVNVPDVASDVTSDFGDENGAERRAAVQ